jgi:hypothetical protein
MALPKGDYRDPMEVVAERQQTEINRRARTCAGCRHVIPSPIKGDTAIACDKRARRPSRSVEESRRCELHEALPSENIKLRG